MQDCYVGFQICALRIVHFANFVKVIATIVGRKPASVLTHASGVMELLLNSLSSQLRVKD